MRSLSSTRLPDQLLALSIFFVGGVIISAVAAPLLWSLILAIEPDIRWPFDRVFRRIAMLVALVLLFCLRKPLNFAEIPNKIRAESWSERGYRTAAGVFLTFVTAGLAIPLVIAHSPLDHSTLAAQEVSWRVFRSIPGALLGSFLEESLFRAAIFCGLVRHLSFWPAASISSLLYATIHFISPPRGFTIESASPLEAISILGAVIGNVFDPSLLPVIFGLFLVGMVLCFAMNNTGSLSLSIGLHAGWFLAAKLAVYLIASPNGTGSTRHALLSHPWSWVSMLLVYGAVALYARKSSGPFTESS